MPPKLLVPQPNIKVVHPRRTHEEDVVATRRTGAHLQAGPLQGQAQLEVAVLVRRRRRGAWRRRRACSASPGHGRSLDGAWQERGREGVIACKTHMSKVLEAEGCKQLFARGRGRGPRGRGAPGQGSPQLELDHEGATAQVGFPTHRPAT